MTTPEDTHLREQILNLMTEDDFPILDEVNKKLDSVMNLITLHTQKARNKDITPDDMLLAQNKRLIEAGDALYERASYTGREFDGTHRLLSASANWLDVRGKNSGEYQTQLKENK